MHVDVQSVRHENALITQGSAGGARVRMAGRESERLRAFRRRRAGARRPPRSTCPKVSNARKEQSAREGFTHLREQKGPTAKKPRRLLARSSSGRAPQGGGAWASLSGARSGLKLGQASSTLYAFICTVLLQYVPRRRLTSSEPQNIRASTLFCTSGRRARVEARSPRCAAPSAPPRSRRSFFYWRSLRRRAATVSSRGRRARATARTYTPARIARAASVSGSRTTSRSRRACAPGRSRRRCGAWSPRWRGQARRLAHTPVARAGHRARVRQRLRRRGRAPHARIRERWRPSDGRSARHGRRGAF